MRRFTAFAAAIFIVGGAFVAGCDTLGASCSADGDCDSGQVCASPACASDSKVCLIPCNSNDDCVANAGAGSTCVDDPLAVGCIGYCSAAN